MTIFCKPKTRNFYDSDHYSTQNEHNKIQCWFLSFLHPQNLAVQRSYNNLDITVKQALSHRPLRSPDGGVLRCYRHEKLSVIMKRVVDAEVRFYCRLI